MPRPPSPYRARLAGLLLAGIAACTRGPERGAPAAARPGDVPSSASPTEIELDVAGGPQAGRYGVRTDEVLCSAGLVGPRSWGVQYSRRHPGDRLGSLQLILDDTARAGHATGAFRFDLVFGRLLDGAGHEIETRLHAPHPRGSGLAQVADSGARGTVVRVDARTDDGVRLAATIRCGQVRRLGG